MKTKLIQSLMACGLALAFAVAPAATVMAQASVAIVPPGASLLLTVEGKVEVAASGTDRWVPAQPRQVLSPGDRLRTSTGARAMVRLSNQSVLRVNESTTVTIQNPTGKRPLLDLEKGSVFMLDRDVPAQMDYRTRLASGAVRGTELVLMAAEDGRTTVALLEGVVDLKSEQGQVVLASGEQAVVEAGKAPVKTAVINAVNLIQWCLYYPGVLDADELGLGGEAALAESLAAYRQGDLLAALAKYPTGRQPVSDNEKVYRAGLLLAAGQVEQTEAALNALGAKSPHGEALRQVIAAVKFQKVERATPPQTASEWVAESYYQQSRSRLDEALKAARNAVGKNALFGFARARVAELEFSFGRTDAALLELDQALKLSPRNAEAVALRGFLLSAKGNIAEAQKQFEEAIAIDGALGHAWLGRGLCHIRQGRAEQGRQDLQTAAALEPQRSIFRSYLGKAYSNEGDLPRADKELGLALKLDAQDPTPPLYRALLNRQQNRINAAVRDLEESIKLNDNRSVYRSRLLLDQDRAVRSANLASIYQDAGMFDVALREAVRAVNSDYGNYSAHLFLANSYDSLRDPRGNDLRYETPWLSEYLLANLLAPVGAGALSQQISQQEYARLFERDRIGFSGSAEYLSRGDVIMGAAHFGNFGNTAYAVETYYRDEHGQAPNSALEAMTVSIKAKQQITPNDSLYLQGIYANSIIEDITQRYVPQNTIPGYWGKEYQEPLVMLGYHHEWSPGSHSLLLLSRLHDRFRQYNPGQDMMILYKYTGPLEGVFPASMVQQYKSVMEVYAAEFQQILQTERHNTVLGTRLQTGTFNTYNQFLDGGPYPNPNYPGFFFSALNAGFYGIFPAKQTHVKSDFHRLSVYGYHNWEIVENLTLAGGITFDHLQFPNNFRLPPLSTEQKAMHQVSPKAGVIWTPAGGTTLRGAYAQYLGGVSFDQSFQLEPSQVAGFNQSLRNIIPTGLEGAGSGPRTHVGGLSLEQKLPTRTYLGISGEWLRSSLNRQMGVLELNNNYLSDGYLQANTTQDLRFRERSLAITANQLLGEEWSLGARYRISQSKLIKDYPAVSRAVSDAFRAWQGYPLEGRFEGVLQQLSLSANFNHRCGFFGRFESHWYVQNLRQDAAAFPNEDFWQLNLFAGYRFHRSLAELQVGLLNLDDRNYHLHPLNVYYDLPRHRTFIATFKVHF